MSFSQRSQSNLLCCMNEILWKDARGNWFNVEMGGEKKNRFPFFQQRPCFLLNASSDLFWQLPHWILFYANKKRKKNSFVVSHKEIKSAQTEEKARGTGGARLKKMKPRLVVLATDGPPTGWSPGWRDVTQQMRWKHKSRSIIRKRRVPLILNEWLGCRQQADGQESTIQWLDGVRVVFPTQ